jgi:hypothetical protein
MLAHQGPVPCETHSMLDSSARRKRTLTKDMGIPTAQAPRTRLLKAVPARGPECAGRAHARQRNAPPPALLANVVGVPAVPPQAWRARQGAGARRRIAPAQRAYAAATLRLALAGSATLTQLVSAKSHMTYSGSCKQFY